AHRADRLGRAMRPQYHTQVRGSFAMSSCNHNRIGYYSAHLWGEVALACVQHFGRPHHGPRRNIAVRSCDGLEVSESSFLASRTIILAVMHVTSKRLLAALRCSSMFDRAPR